MRRVTARSQLGGIAEARPLSWRNYQMTLAKKNRRFTFPSDAAIGVPAFSNFRDEKAEAGSLFLRNTTGGKPSQKLTSRGNRLVAVNAIGMITSQFVIGSNFVTSGNWFEDILFSTFLIRIQWFIECLFLVAFLGLCVLCWILSPAAFVLYLWKRWIMHALFHIS